ncbi:S8 family serine peptidase [Actinoplanes sp. NPDC049596]|uniref:S8 family serine peptidase n=1 Tax=unclassified Actinoplanes TaxID=2626549 RepID=UPI003429FACD
MGRTAASRIGVAIMAGVVVTLAGAPAPGVPPRYAGDAPPALPDATAGGCVGPSPITAGRPSWAFQRVQPVDAWPLTRGAGVRVAVVDTGVSSRAGGLSGAVEPGRNVLTGGSGDADCLGRGTALAAIVAARPAPGSVLTGVAPASSIFPARVVDQRGKVPDGALAEGIEAATAAGAKVILVGMGTATPDARLRAAVRTAIARDAVVVASVADQSPADSAGVGRSAPVWYPAADPDVLAVGGLDASGAPVQSLSPSSGLDLLAPGSDAFSVGPSGSGNYTVGGPAVAAAYVAGAAALVRAYRPDLPGARVRHLLTATAQPSPVGPELDLYAAVSGPEVAVSSAAPRPVRTLAAPHPPRPSTAGRTAGVVALGGVTAAAAAWLVAVAVRQGRRRGWRRP